MTSRRILYSGPARQDLDEIWDYIAANNPIAASKFIDKILKACQSYASQPRLGEARFDLMPDCRHFSVGQYVIYYRPVKDGIELIRILHGARSVDDLQ
ncbi:MAG: type II toxin-antitoxin system RelE/ParE family toxin [Planctomycetia bacterium]